MSSHSRDAGQASRIDGGEDDVTAVDRGTHRVNGQRPLVSEGAAIHPTFLLVGPWGLVRRGGRLVRPFVRDQLCRASRLRLELRFSREFAVAFPLVLDAVIIVVAVTRLLERALGRRIVILWGRRVGAPPAHSWPGRWSRPVRSLRPGNADVCWPQSRRCPRADTVSPGAAGRG